MHIIFLRKFLCVLFLFYTCCAQWLGFVLSSLRQLCQFVCNLKLITWQGYSHYGV